METISNSKSSSLSKSAIRLPKTDKSRSSFFAAPKLTSKLLFEENKKLKELVSLLRSNLQITEENLKKSLKDNSNFEYIAAQSQKIKSLETRLNDSEIRLTQSNSKLLALQQSFKVLSKEKNDLQSLIDEKEVQSETYRAMKNKILECLFKLFTDDSLKLLNLRYMEIDNSFLSALPAIIKRHPSIETIDLEGNYITDIGAKTISEIIANSDINLHEINLNNNRITIEGAWVLLKSMKTREETKFKRVKSLSLLNNDIPKPSEIYLKINEHIKHSKDALSLKYKPAESRRISFININKVIEPSSLKEAQELIDILERIHLSENPDTLHPPIKTQTQNFRLSDSVKPAETSGPEKKSLSIKNMYSPNGEFFTNTVESFVKSGGDINEVDPDLQESLLMHACRIGNVRLLKKILSFKPDLELKNKQGLSSFLIACHYENYEILSFLIQSGSNINTCTLKGAKAIHLAVKEKKPQTICRLVELGLKVNSKDNHSKTPLHYAARSGDLDIGKLLIQLGAQLNNVDFKGRTPAGLAEEKEHFNFADMLEALGGNKLRGYDFRNPQKIDSMTFSSLQRVNEEIKKEMLEADKVYKKLYKNIE